MTNTDIAPARENLPTTPADLIKNLTNVKDAVSSAQSGIPILKMNGKTGIWTYGVERIATEPGQLWAVDPYSFEHGFVCWDNAEPIGEIMRKASEPLPNEDDLPDYGKDWDLQNTVIMKCMTGEEMGMVAINKGSSLGHAKMIRELTASIIAQVETGTDEIYPIVDLTYDSYMNRKQGAEIFNPIMEIVDWKTYDDVMGDDIEEIPARSPLENVEIGEPIEQQAATNEPEPEPEPETKAGRRQRRRAAAPATKSRGRRRTN